MAAKPDYTALDAAILEAIGLIRRTGRPAEFWRIESNVRPHATPLADARNAGLQPRLQKDPWRFTDARLQALKRAGKIRFDGKGWVLL